MRLILSTIVLMITVTGNVLGFDLKQDAPRIDYQGYIQTQPRMVSFGSGLMITWRLIGLELEHEEGDPFDELADILYGGPALSFNIYRLKLTRRAPLSRHWNLRCSGGYGRGTGEVHIGEGFLPLIIAAGLGFSLQGSHYVYSEKLESATLKASLEANFWEIFKAELITGMTYYSFSPTLKELRPVNNWSPSLALALGVRTPFGR